MVKVEYFLHHHPPNRKLSPVRFQRHFPLSLNKASKRPPWSITQRPSAAGMIRTPSDRSALWRRWPLLFRRILRKVGLSGHLALHGLLEGSPLFSDRPLDIRSTPLDLALHLVARIANLPHGTAHGAGKVRYALRAEEEQCEEHHHDELATADIEKKGEHGPKVGSPATGAGLP